MHPFFHDKVKIVPGSLDTPCWVWQRSKAKGYGNAWYDGKVRKTHRIAKELEMGVRLDSSVDVHHECEVKACCNPAHLTTMAHRSHTMIGRGVTSLNREKTHCDFGHPLSGDNDMGGSRTEPDRRRCRTCHSLTTKIRFQTRERQQILDYFVYKMKLFEDLPQPPRRMSPTMRYMADLILDPSNAKKPLKKLGMLPRLCRLAS